MEFFLHNKLERKRKARKRELATFDENQRAVGTLNPMQKMKARIGGRREGGGRHLWPRLVQKKTAEGQNLFSLIVGIFIMKKWWMKENIYIWYIYEITRLQVLSKSPGSGWTNHTPTYIRVRTNPKTYLVHLRSFCGVWRHSSWRMTWFWRSWSLSLFFELQIQAVWGCWCLSKASRRPRWLGRWSYQDQFRGIKSHRVHTRKGFFLHEISWLAESARAWVSYTRWKSTSSGNVELYARQKIKPRTGGGKGRHLWPRLVPKVVKGKTSNQARVSLESESDEYIYLF